MMAQTCIQV